MKNRSIRQHGSATAKEDGRQGQTLPAQGPTQERSPRLPHERDESADSQASAGPAAGQGLGKIAHDDANSDRTDTGRGPVTDAAYRKVKR